MSPTVLLIAALVGLCLGPVLFAALHRRAAPQLALDGFVLVSVVGLVSLHVLPEAYEHAGLWALLAAGAGLLLPLFAEKVRALSHRTSHGLVLGVAMAGLMLHASLDGVGLGGSEGLGLAVFLHRIPVGLGVWWLVRPQFGRRWAVAVLAALCAATVLGFALQTTVIEPTGMLWVQLVQALVAGSLLHVLLHQSVGFHNHTIETQRWRIPGAVGAVLGTLLVVALPSAHGHHFAAHVLDTLLLASPYFIAGFAVMAIIARKRALRYLDAAAPWAVAAIVLAAILVETEVSADGFRVVTAGLFVLVVLLSLTHQGPRDFLLKVLPLDLMQADHHHHEHAPTGDMSHS